MLRDHFIVYRRKLSGAVIIFILMYLNQLFVGEPLKVSLNLVIWVTYSVILFFSKTWWTRNRLLITASIIMIETGLGLVWYQEMNQVYFLAILLLSASIHLSLSKSPIPVMTAMFVTAMLYTRFGTKDLFSFISFVVLSIVLYFYVRSRMQRNEMHELNKQHLVELQDAYDQLQEASVTAMHYAVLDERTRIAREIHDAVGHSLTSLIVQMQALRYMITKDPIHAEQSLEEMLIVARQGLQDIRTSVHSLAADRSKSGITPMKALLSRMEATAKIQYVLHSDLDSRGVNVDVYGILFRVLQEAITNIIRHSKATHVNVILKKEFGNIVMQIQDNGILDSTQKISEGFGLKVMRARIEERGGGLRYLIQKPHGFEITVEIPMSDQVTHHHEGKDG